MSRIANERSQRSSTVPADIVDIVRRIEAEYLEMPGLSVTEAQAKRFWSLDSTTCNRALNALVQFGVLRRTRRGTYVRTEMFSRRSAVSRRNGPP